MGDLNTDPSSENDRRRTETLCVQKELTISHIGPTHIQRQIDHILIPTHVRQEYEYYTQSFTNRYSDHKAICIRLSKMASGTLDGD